MLIVQDVALTPNPQALKFVLNEKLLITETRNYSSIAEAEKDPFAKGIFAIKGIVSVFYMDKFVTIEKNEETSWNSIQKDFVNFLKNFDKKTIPAEENISISKEEETELLGKITEILNTRVRPALAGDGGGRDGEAPRGLPGGLEAGDGQKEAGLGVIEAEAALPDHHLGVGPRLVAAGSACRGLAQPRQQGVGVVVGAATTDLGVGRKEGQGAGSPGRGEGHVPAGDAQQWPRLGSDGQVPEPQGRPARTRLLVLDLHPQLGGQLRGHEASAKSTARERIGAREHGKGNEPPHPFVVEEAIDAVADGDSGRHGQDGPLYPVGRLADPGFFAGVRAGDGSGRERLEGRS